MATETSWMRVEIRADEKDEFCLVGRAVKYGEISSNQLAPGLRERIVAGAFSDSLASDENIVCNFNHNDQSLPLGTTQAGTLEIKDSNGALFIRCQLDRDIQGHCDLYASVKRGDVSEMSFEFLAQEENFTDEKYAGQPCMVRNVTKARLVGVNPVTRPFYGKAATAVAARNQEQPTTAGWPAEVVNKAMAIRDRVFQDSLK